MTLLAYKYKLVYRPGRDNCNGDALSRLPLEASLETVPGDTICLMENLATTPVDVTKVKQWTASDPVMSQVLQFVLLQFVLIGWPSAVEDNTLNPYFTRRNELSVHARCLLWGSRIIIPPHRREEVMNILRETPWHQQNEGISTKLRMAAQDGCTFTPLGMAKPPMVPVTH